MDAVEPYADECPCDEKSLVFRTVKGGVKHYGTQCHRCGAFVAVRKTSIPVNAKLHEYDEGIRETYLERMRRFYARRAIQSQREREVKNAEWWERYDEYLRSDEWKDKRQRVMERDKWTCQACQRRRADEVHHLTYRHVFCEPLFDLVAICELCHRKLTELDRESNG